jgi:cytidine deaminase
MDNFIVVDNLEDLDTESKYLAHKAKEATTHAYAPYSKFHVGAAVLLDNGKVMTGTNQENAAYPSGMCAERVALFAAYAMYPEAKVIKIAIAAKRKGNKELSPATSCGPCRQVMLEVELRQSAAFQIIMLNQDHQWVQAPSAESLLPFCFTNASLEHGEKKHV